MKSELQMRLAKNLKKLRKEQKLTQFELAEKANISKALDIDAIRFFIPIDMDADEQEKFYTDLKFVVTKNFDKYLNEILSRLTR